MIFDNIGKMYIDGEWTESSSQGTRDIFNPATGEKIAVVTEGTVEDAQRAINAARSTFDNSEWRKSTAAQRSTLLFKLADKLEENSVEIARNETLDCGKPFELTQGDVEGAIDTFRYYAGLINKPIGQTYDVPEDMQSMVVKEPVGVCGQIVPWNYPIMMAAWKIAPCLAAGNVTVFKPAEITPINAIRLFELIEEVGFPKGVANLILGAGETVGNELAENHAVDKIAFTGGTDTGRSIMKAAAGNIKKISLELGGKSPNIVFSDADFDAAVDFAMLGAFAEQGQVCTAGSRLLLQDDIYDEFVDELVKRTKKIKIDNGLEEGVELGPLISEEHMEKVLEYIEIGKQEGATLLTGGNRLTSGAYSKGNFVEPTIFTDTTPDMRIVQEEIFGPVLVIQRFIDEKEAIQMANDTIYGLAGSVFTSDGTRALRVAKEIRAGITWINSYHPTYVEAPWGGYKQSGIGRELGTSGLDEYTEEKQINISLKIEKSGWFKNK